MESLYDMTINSLQGEPIELSAYRDKVLLIVNTASRCGFTPQYAGLQQLHQQYQAQGLVVIACPCNQFGQQEPGDPQAIEQGCLVNYGVDFLVTEKIEVNGENSHPLYGLLRQALPGLVGNQIKWNFTKFLIDRQGKPYKRFAPTTKPAAMATIIDRLL